MSWSVLEARLGMGGKAGGGERWKGVWPIRSSCGILLACPVFLSHLHLP